MSEEVYGPERAQRLVALLRALADRIQELDRTGRLLDAAPELQKLFGNARSELFHYEVRSTYDTPEVEIGRASCRERWERSLAARRSWTTTAARSRRRCQSAEPMTCAA